MEHTKRLPPRRWGWLLRRKREIVKWSAVRAGREFGMPPSTLLALETGARRPPPRLPEALVTWLGVPTAQEQALWGLLYAYRPTVTRLATALYIVVLSELRRSPDSPLRPIALGADDLWPDHPAAIVMSDGTAVEAKRAMSPIQAWLARQPDGIIVDWLLATSDAIRWDWDAEAVGRDAWVRSDDDRRPADYLGARVRYPIDGRIKKWVFVPHGQEEP